tara:strand:+ start:377 stop:748 length:372 start_codon:yes stop_codon:yes gene_type:complete
MFGTNVYATMARRGKVKARLSKARFLRRAKEKGRVKAREYPPRERERVKVNQSQNHPKVKGKERVKAMKVKEKKSWSVMNWSSCVTMNSNVSLKNGTAITRKTVRMPVTSGIVPRLSHARVKT